MQRLIERKITVPIPIVQNMLSDGGSYVKHLKNYTNTTIVVNYAAQQGVLLVRGPVDGVQTALFRIVQDWQRLSQQHLTRILHVPGASAHKFRFIPYDPFLDPIIPHNQHYVLQAVNPNPNPNPVQEDNAALQELLSSLLSSQSAGSDPNHLIKTIDEVIPSPSNQPPHPFRALTSSHVQVLSLLKHLFSQIPTTECGLRVRSLPGRVVFHSVDQSFLIDDDGQRRHFTFTELSKGMEESKFLLGFSPGVGLEKKELEDELQSEGLKKEVDDVTQSIKMISIPDRSVVDGFNEKFTKYRELKIETEDESLLPPIMPDPTSICLSIHQSNEKELCVRSSGRVVCKIPVLFSSFYGKEDENMNFGTDFQLIFSIPTTKLDDSIWKSLVAIVNKLSGYPNQGNHWGVNNLPDWSSITSSDCRLFYLSKNHNESSTVKKGSCKYLINDNIAITIPDSNISQGLSKYPSTMISATGDVDDYSLLGLNDMRSTTLPFISLYSAQVGCSRCDVVPAVDLLSVTLLLKESSFLVWELSKKKVFRTLESKYHLLSDHVEKVEEKKKRGKKVTYKRVDS
ncbi:hypothetical protein P9112_009404 [Eukaryota sp. TZLM1-RC]